MRSKSFELGFVHLDDLISHETCDFNRVCRLADQIKKDGYLKNPVLVASFPASSGPESLSPKENQKLLVLDGVDRVSALKLLGVQDVLIQRVDYSDENVELTSWNHLIFKLKKDQLTRTLEKLDLETSTCNLSWKSEALQDRRTVCYLLFRDHSGLVLSQKDTFVENRVKNLSSVIAVYRSTWEIYHPGSDDALPSALESFENATAVNALPVFEKQQVLDLASRGLLFPFGVTRFVIPRWVLGLEISCSVLGAQVPLSEKNSFLKELLSYRIKTKKARFYQESVFLFNE